MVGPGEQQDNEAAALVLYVRYEWLQDVRRRHSPGEQHEHQFQFEPTRLCHSCIDFKDPNRGF